MKKLFVFSLLILISIILIVSCSDDKITNPDPGEFSTVTDIDGNVYQTLVIGNNE